MTAPISVYDAFDAAVSRAPDAPFLIEPQAGTPLPGVRTTTYGRMQTDVARQISRYRDAGYGHGQRVALLLENRPAFFLHYLALNALGVGIVPINPDYRADEIRYLLEHSEAQLAVSVPEKIGRMQEAAAGAAVGHDVPVIDGLDVSGPMPHARIPASHTGAPITRATECALLYTSGTTGRPKGCILSNQYFITAGAGYAAHGGLATITPEGERFYNPLPLFHMNHLAVTATAALLTRNALVLTERFSPTKWWPEVVSSGATIVHYLGIVAATLLNQPVTALERQHKVKFGFGAGVEPQLHGRFEERFGFPLLEVWGMTETGRVTIVNSEPRQIETRAFGRAYPGLDARVVDDADCEVRDGTDGEFVVRSSAAEPRFGFFSGYLKNEAATEDAWRGGWFHTGDIVKRDGTGMFHFVDRKKNIIRRAGENIAAAEIEAVLQAHDAVAQVAVVAAPDEMREEEVFACVVLMAGVAPSEAVADELFQWANERLAYFKAPGWILFLDQLPTTGTQKVQKTLIFSNGEDPRRRAGVLDFRGRKKRR